MAVFAPHTLVTFGGTLNTGASEKEIWQCGVRVMAPGAGGPIADHDAYLIDKAGPLAAWFSAAQQAFPSLCTLDFLKANPINAAGHYSDPLPHIHDYSPHAVGNFVGGPFLPDILGLAVTWVTRLAVRKHVYASHGRIYLPAYGVTPTTPGGMHISAGAAVEYATAGKDLLTLLSAAPSTCVPVVCSPHAGEFEPIIGVRCGNTIDLQRSRKSAVKEVYSAVTFP